MAKYQNKKRNEGKLTQINTPSRYGSHNSMVVERLDDVHVICEDERGRYTTYADRLDNGLTDSARMAEVRS